MPSIDEDIMQLETSYIAGGAIKCNDDVEKNLVFLIKLNIHLP